MEFSHAFFKTRIIITLPLLLMACKHEHPHPTLSHMSSHISRSEEVWTALQLSENGDSRAGGSRRLLGGSGSHEPLDRRRALAWPRRQRLPGDDSGCSAGRGCKLHRRGGHGGRSGPAGDLVRVRV